MALEQGFELSSSTYMQIVFKKHLYCFRFVVSMGAEGKLYVLWIYAFSTRDSCITIYGYPQGFWNQFPAGIRDNLSFWEVKSYTSISDCPGRGRERELVPQPLHCSRVNIILLPLKYDMRKSIFSQLTAS